MQKGYSLRKELSDACSYLRDLSLPFAEDRFLGVWKDVALRHLTFSFGALHGRELRRDQAEQLEYVNLFLQIL